MSDELLDRLRAAAPRTPDGLLEPNHELLEEILMNEQPKPRRIVTPIRLGAVAAAAAAVTLIAVNVAGPGQQAAAPPTTVNHVVAPNMQTIAASTSAAL